MVCTHSGGKQIDFFDVHMTVHGLLYGSQFVDVLDDEDAAGNDEEIPEDLSVQDQEEPVDDVQHVRPVEHLQKRKY